MDSSSDFESGPDSNSDIIKYSDIEYDSDLDINSDFGADITPPSDSKDDDSDDDLLPDLYTNSGAIIPKKSRFHDPGGRLQALYGLEWGIPIPEITKKTGITKSGIYKIRQKAVERG